MSSSKLTESKMNSDTLKDKIRKRQELLLRIRQIGPNQSPGTKSKYTQIGQRQMVESSRNESISNPQEINQENENSNRNLKIRQNVFSSPSRIQNLTAHNLKLHSIRIKTPGSQTRINKIYTPGKLSEKSIISKTTPNLLSNSFSNNTISIGERIKRRRQLRQSSSSYLSSPKDNESTERETFQPKFKRLSFQPNQSKQLSEDETCNDDDGSHPKVFQPTMKRLSFQPSKVIGEKTCNNDDEGPQPKVFRPTFRRFSFQPSKVIEGKTCDDDNESTQRKRPNIKRLSYQPIQPKQFTVDETSNDDEGPQPKVFRPTFRRFSFQPSKVNEGKTCDDDDEGPQPKVFRPTFRRFSFQPSKVNEGKTCDDDNESTQRKGFQPKFKRLSYQPIQPKQFTVDETSNDEENNLRRSQRLLDKKDCSNEEITDEKITLKPSHQINECRSESQFTKEEATELRDTLSPLRKSKPIMRRPLQSAGPYRPLSPKSLFLKPSQPVPKLKGTLMSQAIANSMKKKNHSLRKKESPNDSLDSIESTDDFMKLENMVARPSFDFITACDRLKRPIINTPSRKRKRMSTVISSKTPSLSVAKLKSRRSSIIPKLNSNFTVESNIIEESKGSDINEVGSSISIIISNPSPPLKSDGDQSIENKSFNTSNQLANSPTNQSLTNASKTNEFDTITLPKSTFAKCATLLKAYNKTVNNLKLENHLELNEQYTCVLKEVEMVRGLYSNDNKCDEKENIPQTSNLYEMKKNVLSLNDSLSINTSLLDNSNLDKNKSIVHWEKLRAENKFLVTPSVKKVESIINKENQVVNPAKTLSFDEIESDEEEEKYPPITPKTKSINNFKSSLKKQLEELYD